MTSPFHSHNFSRFPTADEREMATAAMEARGEFLRGLQPLPNASVPWSETEMPHFLYGSSYGNGYYQNGYQSSDYAQPRQTAAAPTRLPLQTMNLPDPFVRSTTPEMPFTAQLSSTNANGAYCVPGGFASKLASALPIPKKTTPSQREYRQQAMLSILDPESAHPLPPPSPRVKNLFLPDADFEKAHQVRQKPQKITIVPLAARPQLEGYKKVEQMPEGPDKEAAKLHNNDLAAVKTANNKMRNNIAASRCRDKKKRAIVARSEEIATVHAELAFWKARAVAVGAGVNDWDRLDGNVKREMIADRRFDAFDFSKDAAGEERVAELAENQNKASSSGNKKKTKVSKKRKAQEVEEDDEVAEE